MCCQSSQSPPGSLLAISLGGGCAPGWLLFRVLIKVHITLLFLVIRVIIILLLRKPMHHINVTVALQRAQYQLLGQSISRKSQEELEKQVTPGSARWCVFPSRTCALSLEQIAPVCVHACMHGSMQASKQASCPVHLHRQYKAESNSAGAV